MLSCKDISHLASDHIDQNLPLIMKMKVKFHLFICRDCKNFMKKFQSTISTINQIKTDTPQNVELQVKSLMEASRHINQENMDK